MQMVHSSLTINEGAVDPVPGKSLEDLDMHIASYLAAGWEMAHYAVHPTTSGIRHHFIWRGPAEGSPFPAGAAPTAGAGTPGAGLADPAPADEDDGT